MSTDNLRHAQYTLAGVQIDDPQEILPFNGTYALEASFTDMAAQSGAPVDTPKTIRIGPPATSSTGLLTVDAAGIIRVNKAGPYAVKSRARVTRAGATGSSQVFFWTEISMNNGGSWITLGNSVCVQLDSSSESQTFFDFSLLDLPAGMLVRQRFARSSLGDNSGDLTPITPSAALITAGAASAPSAQTTVYRVAGFNYL